MKNTKKNTKRKKAIIFDLDGTLTNFREIDERIIYKIFDRKIKWLDDILWWINSKDILKNTMFVLKLRIFLYCIFDFKPLMKSYEEYRQNYFFETYRDFAKYYPRLSKLNEKYKVIVLSNNKFSQGIEFNEIKVINRSSKYKYLKLLQRRCEVEYFVGNNLFDDMLVCAGSTTKTVYVGNNKLLKKIANFSMTTEEFCNLMLSNK